MQYINGLHRLVKPNDGGLLLLTGALRNRSEHKYNGCDQCVAKKLKLGQVFITDYGTCYHATLSCSGLKRSVYLVPISEVNGMGACSKCGDKKE